MKIKEALSLAWAEVEEAELPEHVRERAFGEVVRHLLSADSSPAGQAMPRTEAAGTEPAAVTAGLARLATRLGVPEGALADVLAIENDNVTLHVTTAKISATKSKATKEIALLVTVARQGAGLDESWTDVSHVREELTHYGRYDQSNFSKYLAATGDVFNIRGKPAQLRLTRPGWEAATDLVRSLTGAG
jgi:hypothetical protein